MAGFVSHEPGSPEMAGRAFCFGGALAYIRRCPLHHRELEAIRPTRIGRLNQVGPLAELACPTGPHLVGAMCFVSYWEVAENLVAPAIAGADEEDWWPLPGFLWIEKGDIRGRDREWMQEPGSGTSKRMAILDVSAAGVRRPAVAREHDTPESDAA